MHISQIWRYSVKSMAGEKLEHASIGPLGITGDRAVHVEDASGRFITSRTHPRLLGLPATLDSSGEPFDDVVVVGSAIDDNSRVDMPSGVVRAFDSRTGVLRWKWEPLPPNDSGATPAYDAQRGLLVVNTNNLPSKMGLIPADKYWDEVDKDAQDAEYTQQSGGPYGMFRKFLFAKAHHLPCAPPPWGTLTAVDMTTGLIRWQVPLGSLSPGNLAIPVGAPSLGGPIVTAGGLVFVAGTMIDPSLRAFDVETGKEIWKTQLPTSGGLLR